MSSNSANPPLFLLFSVGCLAAASTVAALHLSEGLGPSSAAGTTLVKSDNKRQLDAEEKAREYRRKIEGEIIPRLFTSCGVYVVVLHVD